MTEIHVKWAELVVEVIVSAKIAIEGRHDPRDPGRQEIKAI